MQLPLVPNLKGAYKNMNFNQSNEFPDVSSFLECVLLHDRLGMLFTC